MSDVWRRRIRIAMVVAPLLIGLFIIWSLRFALLPFLVGLAIAYVLAPAVSFIANLFPRRYVSYHTARGLALLIIYGAAIGTIVGAGFVIIPQGVDESEQFIDSIPDTVDSAQLSFEELYDKYVPLEYHERTDQWLEDAGVRAAEWAADLLPRIVGLLGSTLFIIVGYLTLPLWLFFTLKDHPRGVRSFIGTFPPPWRHDVRNLLGIGDTIMRNYLKAMLLQGLVVGAMSFVALRILGVQFPLALAIIAGFTEMIPIIGPILGAIPAIVVALADRPLLALWVLLAYLLIQQIENNLLVPKVQGDFLRLHPAIIMVLLVLAGATGGIIFVILVVPLAALVRDLYQYTYLRFGNVPPDVALDRALGEYRARAIDERLLLESVVPAAELGNLGYDYEYDGARRRSATEPGSPPSTEPSEPDDAPPGPPA